ncbi:ABC transporter ATP-binding protein [Clostridium botulinum C]|uniref:ABC transporter ATP-binding protein n=3 Tax=Clostridium botulinum TaxID=1491 RepID=A0A9Q4XVK4_CLOBO|nr:MULTISPECIES: ABC transporter ATP-binding protein [Clostridium]AYF54585.1 ABC transporter ATP-binding protein [Clostridium novyi]EES90912.1 hemin import ATP-binding protein HmuV [Clostridium botulinum D str. 1873]MBO3441626.1 ABC transporter ATP-binding protein [Clostridium haemolyticum]MCD3194574.1 ABC transporter ATP-binding protein [Clostridium botulinum C]MCD3199728.1 ABC transporter ATP-binding protein [Clostridium botulinum C]
MENLLKIKNLNTGYKDKLILDNINLNIKEGELTMLLGVNGAGKTTLLKSIAGLKEINEGEINYNNLNILKLTNKERGKLLAYIPQQISIKENYTVEDVILMGVTPYLGIFQMPKEKHHNLVDKALNELNLMHLKHKYIKELSGGEKRRVYLGRILVQKCNILLLDEPNTFLDYIKQQDFFNFLKNFVKNNSLFTLITLHDINLALRYGDSIVILNNNKILDVIRCDEKGYEKKFLNLMEQIYERKFQLYYTDKGPMILY